MPKFTHELYAKQVGINQFGRPNFVFKKERAKLHREIKDKFLAEGEVASPGTKPVAIVMMGATASGKSTATKQMKLNKSVKIDADAIKWALPEYREAVSEKALDGAFMVHVESSTVATELTQEAIAQRKHILIDGTGADERKMRTQIEHLRNQGYAVNLVAVFLDPDEGMLRMKVRAANVGRWIDTKVVSDLYEKVPKVFLSLHDRAHSADAFSNDVPKGQPGVHFFSKTKADGPQILSQKHWDDLQRYAGKK